MTLEYLKNKQEEININLKQTLYELQELRQTISRDEITEEKLSVPEIKGEGLLNETLRAQQLTEYLLHELIIVKEELRNLTYSQGTPLS